MATKTRKRRRAERMAWLLGSIGGISAILIVRLLAAGPLGWPAGIAAFLLGGGMLALPMALYASLTERVIEASRQQRALINVRPLAGALPLDLRDWAIDPHFAHLLVRMIVRERPRLIVECGSGSSTVIMAATLRELGRGRILSLDHQTRFSDRTRERLASRELEPWAEVVDAPLVERSVDGRRMPWYSGYEEYLEADSIDMLVIDGPPKNTGPRARYPAVPLLRGFLSNACMILLDDGRRRSERRSANEWSRQLPGSIEYVEGGRGAFIIRLNKRSQRVAAPADST